MKRLLVPLFMVILLAVGGVGVGGHFGYGPAAKFLYKPKAPEPPPPPKRHTVVLGEVVTPIVHNHVIQRQIAMDLDVIVEDKAGADADVKVPLMLSQIRLDMLDFLPMHSDVKSPADRQAVHDRIMFLVKDILGQDAVNDVVMRTFYVHG